MASHDNKKDPNEANTADQQLYSFRSLRAELCLVLSELLLRQAPREGVNRLWLIQGRLTTCFSAAERRKILSPLRG